MAKEESAISPSRAENFPEWYQAVIKGSDTAEVAPVRGCMVIKPWGYGIWELIQKALDAKLKETGHENAYFPLFIPLSFLEKEASHIEGFAKECAVVTHHRLESKEGKLVPTSLLEEPLVVRPTSETIIGHSFAKWVSSYRDLPLLINQWANVVRWEMRTRLFLRTSEFLWQEGHTVHASAEEALNESKLIHDLYVKFVEEYLAMPVIPGEKPQHERFPGAENSFTIESMMQDGKALQSGTSHYLGQNFARAFDIKFLNKEGVEEHGYTTSWGVSTRLIGGMIMTHGDDDGLRVPPRIAPQQIVILPVIPKEEDRTSVIEYARKLEAILNGGRVWESPIRVTLDLRDLRGGEKNWQWVRRGIPLRIEVGPKDIAKESVVLYRRDKGAREKEIVLLNDILDVVTKSLGEVQQNLFLQAKEYRESKTHREIKFFTELRDFFDKEDGFVIGGWCGEGDSENLLSELKISIRCILPDAVSTPCLLTSKEAKYQVIYARSY